MGPVINEHPVYTKFQKETRQTRVILRYSYHHCCPLGQRPFKKEAEALSPQLEGRRPDTAPVGDGYILLEPSKLA